MSSPSPNFGSKSVIIERFQVGHKRLRKREDLCLGVRLKGHQKSWFCNWEQQPGRLKASRGGLYRFRRTAFFSPRICSALESISSLCVSGGLKSLLSEIRRSVWFGNCSVSLNVFTESRRGDIPQHSVPPGHPASNTMRPFRLRLGSSFTRSRNPQTSACSHHRAVLCL
jgi:hypothetical protein